eukprot:Partr_v1_DN25467_c0_g1_i1_m53680 putative serine incorporator
MGLCLACMAAETMCCVVGGAVKCCCCVIPVRTSVTTRLFYTLGFVLTTVFAWIFSRYGHLVLDRDRLDGTQTPVYAACSEPECWNFYSVYRIALGFILYHSFLVVVLLGVRSSQDIRAILHNGWWPVKFLLWAGSILGCFFIPADRFDQFHVAAFAFSFVFIIIQSILLVNLAWGVSEFLVGKMENDEGPGWKWLLVIGTLLLYGATLTMIGLLYQYYTNKSGCAVNAFFISFNLVICIAISVISVLPKVQEANPRSGILQAGLLSIYITYLVASAITSQPNNADFSCGPTDPSVEESKGMKIIKSIGIVFTFLALGNQVSGSSSSSDILGSSDDKDDEAEETKYNYSWFHAVYAMGGFYVASVLTNWATTAPSADSTSIYIDYGFPAMWIRVSTGWICALLYVWSLVAPILLPDRDFGNR